MHSAHQPATAAQAIAAGSPRIIGLLLELGTVTARWVLAGDRATRVND